MENEALDKLNAWLQDFEYDSEPQRKGVLAFLFWLKSKDELLPDTPMVSNLLAAIRPFDLHVLEKIREGQEWMVGLIGDHVSLLQQDIKKLREDVDRLKKQAAVDTTATNSIPQ